MDVKALDQTKLGLMMKFIIFKLENITKICTLEVIIRELIATRWMGIIKKIHGFSLEVV